MADAIAATSAAIDGANLTGGERREAIGKRTFQSLNPAFRSEVIGTFPRSDAADVDAAVLVAEQAFQEWRQVPWPARGDIILRAAMIMAERKEELARLMTREMGKVLTEARGDVQEGIDMGKYMAGQSRLAYGETVPSELRNKWAMTMRQPLGVIGVITPWNFPVAIPTWKIFPALLCGNTVVFKPAEDSPACALWLAEILEEAGLPRGVLNVVFGFGEEAGDPLVRHPGVSGISFTGSAETGALIGESCGRLLKRCSLELGGKNAIVVLDDADLELAVDGALWGAFGTTGQRCTASSRLIVTPRVLEEFTDMLVSRTGRLRIGDGLDETVQVGPMVSGPQRDRAHRYTEIGVDEGALLLAGGDRATDASLSEGFFYRPTIFAGVTTEMRIAQEEIFGPTTAIIPAASAEDAIVAANSTRFGLSLSIYTNDVQRAFGAINDFEAGIVYVNAPTIGAEIQLPFGGVKNTGNGHREAGRVAFDQFSEWKSIYIDYSGRLQRAQIDSE